jgi:hypothetical protein
MAGTRSDPHVVKVITRALTLITEAMDVLDAHGIAPQAAAHLALAQQQLRQESARTAI